MLRLVNYWNQTMLGLSSRLSSEQIERLNGWAIEFRLPFGLCQTAT
jgi:hypothetical protein